MIEQWKGIIDSSSNSSWSSFKGNMRRKNWFRRVSRKDVRTVFDYLAEVNAEKDERLDDETETNVQEKEAIDF